MITKNDCLNYLANNLAKSSNWRRLQSQLWPDDARNERAANSLFALAAQATSINDDHWNRISPHFHPTNRAWYEAISRASREVGFKSFPDDFDDYMENVVEALSVLA